MANRIAILGSGAMGTACAVLLTEHDGQQVTMWSHSEEHARELQTTRENSRLLPGVRIPDSVQVTANVAEAVDAADFLVVAIPTRYLRGALTTIAGSLKDDRPVVSVVKGIESETFQRPSEIVADVLGQRTVVALGGPSHAEEIARRLPASVVAACGDRILARQVQEMFNTDRFRVYTNLDMIGVELAGALKNVIAIAAGICDGLGFGDNAKSALMTRGLVEITRFGLALGAEPLTFAGLAGMGDLITTCISPYGRNRMVGEKLGRGESLEQILGSMDAVAEGVTTTRAVFEYAEANGIDMPVTSEVFHVLFNGRSPQEATDALMARPPRPE